MGLRVLVVDDSPVTRIMLSDMIEQMGHQAVAQAESMGTALEAFKANKPDLVLLDLALAQGDGISTLKSLRQIDPQAQVLVITGNPQQKVREEVLAAGARGLLNKPINLKEFSAAVSAISPKP